MKLAQRFEFKTKWLDMKYRAVKHADSETYTVSWESDGAQYKREFTTEQVSAYIIDAVWLVQRVTVDGNGATLPDLSAQIDMEPVEGSFAAEQPYVFGNIVYVNEEPEYLPPDDLEPLAVIGVELENVRSFLAENPGWYVEVDADFYAVKNYDHDDVVFTVANEAQLAEVMQAIRILNKYEDRG